MGKEAIEDDEGHNNEEIIGGKRFIPHLDHQDHNQHHMEGRKRAKDDNNNDHRHDGDGDGDVAVESTLPQSYPSDFTATSSLGRRIDVFLRPATTSSAIPLASSFVPAKRLLPVSVQQLEKQLEETWAQQHMERLEHAAHQPEPSVAEAARPTERDGLWVDKYRSGKYTDLLSDEKMNRDVLKWVKSWDASVHPKAPAPLHGPPADPRPEQRLLLIAGPAGLGKTTLAHAVAKAAGYRVVEVNASDERSAKALGEIIGNAMGNTSVAEGEKPCLVVLDEIDGVDGEGAIEFLVQMVKEDKPKVIRPVIAICNDMYVSALRPLRKCARVMRMESVRLERLMARLRHICRAEGVSRLVDDSVLGYLCQMTNNDARSAINTLQFITKASSLRRGIPITVDTLTRLNISPAHTSSGAHFGFFQALSHTLTMQPAVTRTQKGSTNIDRAHHFQQVWRHVQDANHDNLLSDALFTNYLSLPSMVGDLSRVDTMSEWFALYDTCLTQIHQTQHYELQGVIPALGVAANHFLRVGSYVAQGSTLRNLQFPKEEANLYKAKTGTRDIVHDYLAGIQGSEALQYLGLDVSINLHQRLPYLLAILDPLQPAHITWLGRNVDPQRREQIMKQITQGMRFYGLDYVPTSDSAQATPSKKRRYHSAEPGYRLDPPLDQLVHAFGLAEHAAAQGSSRDHEAILHMIFLKLRALDAPSVAPAEVKQQPVAHGQPKPTTTATTATATTSVQAPVLRDFFGRALDAVPLDASARLSTLRKELESLKKGDAGSRDQKTRLMLVEAEIADLERKSAKAAQEQEDKSNTTSSFAAAAGLKEAAAAPPQAAAVRFKFNAGATQAVRRTIYIKDFLL